LLHNAVCNRAHHRSIFVWVVSFLSTAPKQRQLNLLNGDKSIERSSGIKMTSNEPDESTRAPAAAAASSFKQGIDIRQALDILSARTSHDHSHSHSNVQDGCQQCATDESKTMGQTIDLNALAVPAATDPEVVAKSMKEEKQQLHRVLKMRQTKIRARLQNMSVKDLLQAVMEAQRERVATYQSFDR
jgi:hypothetical protein